MKKIKTLSIFLIIIFFISILLTSQSYGNNMETYRISLIVKENENNEDVNFYILLPKQYIEHAIYNAQLNIKYEGTKTIQENNIPGIEVKKQNIQDETYVENGIEYVQILLEKTITNEYIFDILKNYFGNEKIELRVKNNSKDYIMHIDNFKEENGICKIEYNYTNNTIKQPDRIVINFGALILVIILLIIALVAILIKLR